MCFDLLLVAIVGGIVAIPVCIGVWEYYIDKKVKESKKSS